MRPQPPHALQRALRSLLLTALLSIGSAHAAEALRPAFGKPLQAAQEAIAAKQYKTALSKVAEAEKAGGQLSAYERSILEQMRAAAALGLGDMGTALNAYDAALATGQISGSSEVGMLDTMVKLAYRGKQYGKAADLIQRYQRAGGTSAATLTLLPQSYYLAGDYGRAQQAAKAQIAADERAGRQPDNTLLQILASSALKQNDTAGYIASLEKLVQYSPKPDYWKDLIGRSVNASGFSDKLILDVYRLRSQVGVMDSESDYMSAAQLAIQAGLPSEAAHYTQAGRAAGVLGSGPSADRHQRLEDMIERNIAEDRKSLSESAALARQQASGEALISTGLAYVGYGEYDKGIGLIQEGIAKGGLKRPQDAQLHLGYAQAQAGQTAEARASFQRVSGSDGSQRLAQLWLLALK